MVRGETDDKTKWRSRTNTLNDGVRENQGGGEEWTDDWRSFMLTLLNKLAERERGGGHRVGYAQIPTSSSYWTDGLANCSIRKEHLVSVCAWDRTKRV